MDIRTMTPADIPFAMRLKGQNNWNQLEADWQRQLALEPSGSFVAELGGVSVGTACACIFGDVAWVNFVLVDKDHRGQGIGAALMRHVIQWLDERSVPTIRLDATALGQPVYAKLGFVGGFTLHRFEGILHPLRAGSVSDGPSRATVADASGSCRMLARNDLPDAIELDELVTMTRREKLLRHLYEANPTNAFKSGNLDGYVLCRPGSNAWQIGPLQGLPDAARALLAHVAQQLDGQRVYLDVPVDNAIACECAQSLGLTTQRTFLRMTRGKRIDERLDLFWAGSGPEKG